jgi:hypothetical protein
VLLALFEVLSSVAPPAVASSPFAKLSSLARIELPDPSGDEPRTLTITSRTADRLSRPVLALFFTVRMVFFCFVAMAYLPVRVTSDFECNTTRMDEPFLLVEPGDEFRTSPGHSEQPRTLP